MVEPAGFADGLDVEYEREREESKMILRLWVCRTESRKLPLTEIRKPSR